MDILSDVCWFAMGVALGCLVFVAFTADPPRGEQHH